MITLLLLVSVICQVRGQLIPLIYAAPSAVSHQSRIDITHNPGVISAPLIYSPATALYASQKSDEKVQETVISPVFTADTILTPVALSFFHNLPLARALEHPISIDKAQEENDQNNELSTQNMDSVKAEDKEVQNTGVETIQGGDKLEEKDYVIIADGATHDVTTHEPTRKTTGDA